MVKTGSSALLLEYNSVYFSPPKPLLFSLALPCRLVAITSFMDSLMYIGNILRSRDYGSCEKGKCIGTSVQITYRVKNSVYREA